MGAMGTGGEGRGVDGRGRGEVGGEGRRGVGRGRDDGHVVM